MLMNLGSLKAVEPSLTKLISADLPIKVSYQLSKLYDSIKTELTKAEELRQGLVKKYGEVDPENESNMKVSEANMQAFVNGYNELMSVDIELTFEPVKVQTLLDYNERLEKMGHSPISLTAVDISNLKTVRVLSDDEEIEEKSENMPPRPMSGPPNRE